jgi:hypothetical protein
VDFSDLVVFAADRSVEQTLRKLGVHVFRHDAFGRLPQAESNAYAPLPTAYHSMLVCTYRS